MESKKGLKILLKSHRPGWLTQKVGLDVDLKDDNVMIESEIIFDYYDKQEDCLTIYSK